MTPAATPEALAESLRKSLAMAANDPGNVIRADGTKVGYKGDRCMGGWIADAIIAGPLAPLLTALATATAEATSLRAEVEAKDRALQQVKSWIDTDLPAGTSRAGTMHRVVTKALDRTALARAATAGEGQADE